MSSSLEKCRSATYVSLGTSLEKGRSSGVRGFSNPAAALALAFPCNKGLLLGLRGPLRADGVSVVPTTERKGTAKRQGRQNENAAHD